MDTRRKWSLIGGIGILMLVVMSIFVQPVLGQSDPTVPQVTVFPEQLERISWSAIIAGSVVALIVQLAINLLAVGIGASTIRPVDQEDSASLQSLGTSAVVAILISMLVSLFIGGWLAARFSGTPERVDGLLHGVMVWGVVTLVTLFLLTSTLGRFMSGITALLGQGLRMAGLATQAVAKGTATAAEAVARGAATTAQNVVDKAQDAAGNAQQELKRSPEVADIMRKRDEVMDTIRSEASKIMQQTGLTPETVKAQAESASEDIQDAAKYVVQHPADAQRVFNETLTRILNRGQALANQADEDKIVELMVQRGNVTEDQARQAISRWENSLRNTQQQLNYVMQQAKEQVGELRSEAEARVEAVKEDAEQLARETAQATSEAISRLALAAFVAIAIGIFAAGIGGYVGTPEVLPTAGVSTSQHIQPNSIQPFS